MDRFGTLFALADNAHPQHRGREYRRRTKCVQPPSRATIGTTPIYFMEGFVQELKPNNYRASHIFGEWADLHFGKKILFSNGVRFSHLE